MLSISEFLSQHLRQSPRACGGTAFKARKQVGG